MTMSYIDCYIYNRANNFALVRLDFADKFYAQKNIVDRVPFNTRIAGFGGTIG